MSAPTVSIIGAGLSGLALGRCLLKRGIYTTVYERDSTKTFRNRHNYAITLHPWAYNALLNDIGIGSTEFLAETGINQTTDDSESERHAELAPTSVRVNRNRLEQLLSQGLDIRWEHQLEQISHTTHGNTLKFSNGNSKQTNALLVGADGPHSIVRQAISPNIDFRILPYAVYNGKRRVTSSDFKCNGIGKSLKRETMEQHHGTSLLRVSIDDISDGAVGFSWTYSRTPLHGTEPDALYRPTRTKGEAKEIPSELSVELSAIALSDEFAYFFDSASIRQDRILNWLMRSMLVPRKDLEGAVSRGLVLVGDCAHGTPILGGDGANQAFLDAVQLADAIAHHSEHYLSKFYSIAHERWQNSVRTSEETIAKMHEH